jgi:hypothetical protein
LKGYHIKEDDMVENVAGTEEKSNTYGTFVGKPGGRRRLERGMHGWEETT